MNFKLLTEVNFDILTKKQ
jgi:hypothetical protein